MEITRALLHALPKTDLHVHLDGSVRPATMIELARELDVALPTYDAAALADYMYVRDAQNLVDYLDRFECTIALMQTTESIERIAYELAVDSAAENTWYTEVRFCPALNTRRGLTHEQVISAALRGLKRAEMECDVQTGLIVCALRQMPAFLSLELATTAVEFADRGVVAFDLAGPEAGHPPAVHHLAFDYAANANLAVTIHAGEAYGAPSIHEAIHKCHARRIGHGTRLHEDPDLMRFVNDFRIPLEVCLTSNMQTRVTPSLSDHPARLYYDHGLVVTLNTDNRLMSGTTMTDELWRAHTELGFDWEALCDVVVAGFESAFLPYPEKVSLLEDVVDELHRLEDANSNN